MCLYIQVGGSLGRVRVRGKEGWRGGRGGEGGLMRDGVNMKEPRNSLSMSTSDFAAREEGGEKRGMNLHGEAR